MHLLFSLYIQFQISLFSRRACHKVITMTGKKRWGARARWRAIAIFQLTELNMYGLLTKCEVKMTGYWPSSFFSVFRDGDEVEVHKLSKKRKNEDNIQPS